MSDPKQRTFGDILKRISGTVFSHQAGVFLIFLAISTVLWFVTSLSEEVNRQVTCRLRFTNIPDSINLISQPPVSVSANVRGRGSYILRHFFGSEPTVDINFNNFSKNGRLVVSKNNLFELVQGALGDEGQLQGVYPDSIGLYYTWLPPVKVPVKVEVTASSTPNAHLIGHPTSLTDSVLIYYLPSITHRIKSISTADVHIAGVERPRIIKVALVPPVGTKAVPDSVEIKINVEPYITVSRQHVIESINVPEGYSMTFSPQKIRASYRVPKSQASSLPEVHIYADYNTIAEDSLSSSKVALISDPWLSYIFLDVDSVNYTISASDY